MSESNTLEILKSALLLEIRGKAFYKKAAENAEKQIVKDFFEKMFSPHMFQWELLLALTLGAILVAPFGAFTTSKINEKHMHFILGVLIIVLGLWTLIRTYS